jgi:hypothetical protein
VLNEDSLQRLTRQMSDLGALLQNPAQIVVCCSFCFNMNTATSHSMLQRLFRANARALAMSTKAMEEGGRETWQLEKERLEQSQEQLDCTRSSNVV